MSSMVVLVIVVAPVGQLVKSVPVEKHTVFVPLYTTSGSVMVMVVCCVAVLPAWSFTVSVVV